MKPGHAYESVGGLVAAKSLCFQGCLPIVPNIEFFPMIVKIHLHCTAGCPIVCLGCRSQAVSTNAISKDACIISKGNGWAFLEALTVSFTVNGPCSNTLRPCCFSAPVSPAERELLRMYRSQYVEAYPFGRSSESNLQKDVKAGERNPIVY